MLSWEQRAMRRGGMSFLAFEAAMMKLGFQECEAPRDGALHEYTHPSTGGHRYTMRAGDRYSAALVRMREELQARSFGDADPDTDR